MMLSGDRVQRKIGKILKVILIGIIAVAFFGNLVKYLWNGLMPSIFPVHAITFWQAVGLLVLCKLLFGGFRGGPGRGMHWRGRMREKWARMSPEEREKFSSGMAARVSRHGCWPGQEPGPTA